MKLKMVQSLAVIFFGGGYLFAGPAMSVDKEQAQSAVSDVFCQPDIRETVSSLMNMDRLEQTAKFTQEGYEHFKKERSDLRLKLKGQFYELLKSKGIVTTDFERYLSQLNPADRGQLAESMVKGGQKNCPTELQKACFDLNRAEFYIVGLFNYN